MLLSPYIFYSYNHLSKLKHIIKNKYNFCPLFQLINDRLDLLNRVDKFSTYLYNQIENNIQIDIENKSYQQLNNNLQHNLKITRKEISAIIITQNEERCIKRCINSIINKVNELIIVDTGSTDNTIPIIKSYKDGKIKLYQYKWRNNFSDARNFALQKVTSDWVFFIDSDEYLDDKLNKEHFSLLINLFNNFPLKNSIILSPLIINHNEHISRNVKRIFLKSSGIKYFGLVHEEPRKDIKKYGADVFNISVNLKLYHDGYTDKVIREKDKINRNIRLLEKMIDIEPENPKWKFFMVRDGLEILNSNILENLIKEIKNSSNSTHQNKYYNDYTIPITNLLLQLKFRNERYKEVIAVAKNLDCLIPNNSNSMFFSVLSKIFIYKRQINHMLDEIIEYRGNNFHSQNGMLHSEGYHIDFLIALLLNENGYYGKATKYYKFLKDKFFDEDLVNKLYKT